MLGTVWVLLALFKGVYYIIFIFFTYVTQHTQKYIKELTQTVPYSATLIFIVF
nr:MAG TPA: hypothetical protein [Caudoviricetes sp.]